MNCLEFKNIKVILSDVEGTTSDIRFVKEVMFPYSRERLPQFLQDHCDRPEVQEALAEVPGSGIEEKLQHLLNWIDQDVKAAPLKKLQGMLWKGGFEEGDFQAHVYPDVPQRFREWKDLGLKLAIYSSGSVQAQQLYFKHTEVGDLTPLFLAHFDLQMGGKKEAQSYTEICQQLETAPESILFLSDIPDELSAAEKAGFAVVHLLRPGTEKSHFPAVTDFYNIKVNEEKCD